MKKQKGGRVIRPPFAIQRSQVSGDQALDEIEQAMAAVAA